MSEDEEPSFIKTRKGSEFSELVLQDFENGLSRNGFICKPGTSHPRLWDFLGRLAGRVNFSPRDLDKDGDLLLVGMMGLAERQLFPYALSNRIVPFIWDCWPSRHQQWQSFFRRHHFPIITFTTLNAAQFWQSELPESRVVWMAEAIDATHFTAGPPLTERTSVLLEIGRRHERAHGVAKEFLTTVNAGHVYPEENSGNFLPTRNDLVAALHDSRSLLCYPGSISDPMGRTGAWESMTHRYLEAVASKTIVLGHIPMEMIELFGFEPGLTVTEEELPDALEAIRTDVKQFQPIVDRSYNRLLEVATWDVRSNQLKELLSARP